MFRNSVQLNVQKPCSIFVGGRQTEWRHSSSKLISDCVAYSAHYLGSVEISNVESTEDSRRAMVKLKVRVILLILSESHKEMN